MAMIGSEREDHVIGPTLGVVDVYGDVDDTGGPGKETDVEFGVATNRQSIRSNSQLRGGEQIRTRLGITVNNGHADGFVVAQEFDSDHDAEIVRDVRREFAVCRP